jgi:hypothetical protein
MRYILMVSVFLFWLLPFLPSCHQQQSGWNGTVSEVDGVTVIDNPVEPMYGNQIVFGYQKDYELYIHDAKGQRQKIIRKKYTPVKVTWDWVEELFEGEEPPPQIKKMPLPDHHFPFQRIISDDEGRIFVMTFERRPHSNGYYYDVFSREGKFIVKILLKTRPLLIKNHKLFTVEEDEDGFPLVERYGVTWNL